VSAASTLALSDDGQDTSAPHPVAVEYSDAYQVRRKIHKIASYTMLPLFVADTAVGQSMYTGTRTDSRKNAHAVLGSSIGVLFGVNTVTGAMNLWEARNDPNGRTKRMVHGLLMMAADAGFFATSLTAPEGDRQRARLGQSPAIPTTHRTIAIASMGAATAGYLMMLFGGK
jgi:hypothetical protein